MQDKEDGNILHDERDVDIQGDHDDGYQNLERFN